MRVHCRTNLDGAKRLTWPTELPAVPQIGHRIRSTDKSPAGKVVELEVCGVTWICPDNHSDYIPVIELNLPTLWTVSEFEKIHGF